MSKERQLPIISLGQEETFFTNRTQNLRVLMVICTLWWLLFLAGTSLYFPELPIPQWLVILVPSVWFLALVGTFLPRKWASELKPYSILAGLIMMQSCIAWLSANPLVGNSLWLVGAFILLFSGVLLDSGGWFSLFVAGSLLSFSYPLVNEGFASTQEFLLVAGWWSMVIAINGFQFFRKSQEATREQQQQDLLASFYQQVQEGIIIINTKGQILDLNQKAQEMLAAPKAIWQRNQVQVFFDEAYSPSAIERIFGTVLNKGVWVDTIEVVNARREIIWADVVFRKAEVGRDIVIYLNLKDATNKILGRAEQKEQEVKYRLLMEESLDGMVLLTPDGKVQEVNQTAISMLGYSFDEISDKEFLPLMQWKAETGEDIALSEIVNTEKERLQVRHSDKYGNTLILEVAGKWVMSQYCQIVFRDITPQVRDQAALIRNERLFRALIETSREILLIIDSSTRIHYLSPSFHRLLQIDAEKVMGAPVVTMVKPEGRNDLNTAIEQVLGQPENSIELPTLLIKSGEGIDYFFEGILTNLLDDPAIKGIVLTLHDVSARRRSEDQLAKVNFELDSFIYKSSHDMRAPLMSILGLVNLARKANKDELSRYFDMMEKGVYRIDKFIRDLTYYSRNDRMKIEQQPINFHEIVKEIVESLRFMQKLEKVKISVEVKDQTTFYSDAMRLAMILSNLLSNAIKYHDIRKYNPYVKILVRISPIEAVVEVSDNGIGIEQAYVDKIFDMFYRASEWSDGSGLGLYVVKSVVSKLQGSVTVTSTFKEGSTFVFKIPNIKPRRSSQLLTEDDDEQQDEDDMKVIPLHHRALDE